MLKGNNPQTIRRTLNIPEPTVYRDIKFLTEKSKRYIYDVAKGLHVLAYQRAIEGIGLTLTEAWNKYNDPKVPEKQKVSYLRLTKDCNVSMILLTEKGPGVIALEHLNEKLKSLGIVDSIRDDIDTSDPKDFPDDPKLLICFRRFGDKSYSHYYKSEDEYCYIRDKEKTVREQYRNGTTDNTDSDSNNNESDTDDDYLRPPPYSVH